MLKKIFETRVEPNARTYNNTPYNLSSTSLKENILLKSKYISSTIKTENNMSANKIIPPEPLTCNLNLNNNRPPLKFDQNFLYDRNNQIKLIQMVN